MSSAISNELFKKCELVSSADPNLNPSDLVFMDSDSEDPPLLQGGAMQEDIVDLTENPIHVTVKMEEEVIIEHDSFEFSDNESDEDMSKGTGNAFNSPARKSSTVQYEFKTSFDANADIEITRVEPPEGMPPPPPSIEETEQFELIPIPEDGIKTEAETGSANTSLVDHAYSQPEKDNNRDFCDVHIQDLLNTTGLQNNQKAVNLLSKFAEFAEHFVDDPESQFALYLTNFKRSLVKVKVEEKIAEERIVEEEIAEAQTEVETKVEPKFDIPGTQSDVGDAAIEATLSELLKIDLPATQPSSDFLNASIDLPATQTSQLNERESDVKIDLEVIDMNTQEEQKPDTELVSQLNSNVKKVGDFGQKLSNNASALLNTKIENEEGAAEMKTSLLALIKESRKEYRAICAEVRSANREAEININEKSKKKIINYSSDSSGLTDSDFDVLRRPIPKPAVVSSTKEDSEPSELEIANHEEVEERSEDEEQSGPKDFGKEIDKLLDFNTLWNHKPASSKKVSKPKRLKKLKKKQESDIESLLDSSSSDDSGGSVSSTDSEREVSDEEEKMRLRQNDEIRDALLQESDMSDSDTASGLSDWLKSEDEDSTKKKDVKPKQTKPSKPAKEEEESESDKESDAEPEPKRDEILIPPTVLSETTSGEKRKDENDSDESRAKKRVKRDSIEREIFRKDFLDGPSSVSNSQESKSSKKEPIPKTSPTKSDDSDSDGIPGARFEKRRIVKEVNMEKFFEKIANAHDDAGATTSKASSVSKPVPINNEDEWISLSSDSDSEISMPANGSANKTRKPNKLLTDEELQEETKKAQKEENHRVKRLEKKNENLTEMISQRMSQQSDDMAMNELILDYDPKTKQMIPVDPGIVRHLKDHQREGIKFMYDTCYGSIGDDVKTESGCILAHCMGLGKTLQLITLLHTLIVHPQLKTRRVIIICPKSTIHNWEEELHKWLDKAEKQPVLNIVYLDQPKFSDRVSRMVEWYNDKHPGVLLINYEAYRNMVLYNGSHKKRAIQIPEEEVTRLQTSIARCLVDPGPDLVVCDEGHVIKNPKGAINRSITGIKTKRRIVLTGTPVQNNLNEYYAMVNWIKPAFLGTVKEFNNLYANPIKEGQHTDSAPSVIKRMKQRSFILHRKLSKFVQRKEVTVLREYLPQLHQYCIFVPLTEVQEKLYERFLEQNPVLPDGGRGRQLLNDYTALRKIWTHPKVLQNAYERAIKGELNIDQAKKSMNANYEDNEGLEDDLLDVLEGKTGVKNKWWGSLVTDFDLESIISSNKLILLFQILEECHKRREKCLVFSAFVAVLNVVEGFMKKINGQNPNDKKYGYDEFNANWEFGKDYLRLDGSTKQAYRHKMIQKFNDTNDTRMRCFLISAKAGGQGINLIGANRCVILDTAWNPSSDQQNIFRIYRLGQRKTCFVYRLIGHGTMEEKVYSRSVTKQAMSGRVVDKMQIDRHYRHDELAQLYVLTKTDYNNRPIIQPPTDEILKYLLHRYPRQAFKYHDHERLLENKPDQDLNEDEINEAWQQYEDELRGPQRPVMNGNFPVAANEPFRPEILNSYYAALYQPPFYGSEYMLPNYQSLLQSSYDLSAAYRTNSLASSSATSANLAPSSSTSSNSTSLRNQLNAANLPALFGPYSPMSTFTSPPPTSPKPKTTARRPSNSKKTTVNTNQPMMTMQQRINGSVHRHLNAQAKDTYTGQNSSENVVILPDDDLPTLSNSPLSRKDSTANVIASSSNGSSPKPQIIRRPPVATTATVNQTSRIVPNPSVSNTNTSYSDQRAHDTIVTPVAKKVTHNNVFKAFLNKPKLTTSPYVPVQYGKPIRNQIQKTTPLPGSNQPIISQKPGTSISTPQAKVLQRNSLVKQHRPASSSSATSQVSMQQKRPLSSASSNSSLSSSLSEIGRTPSLKTPSQTSAAQLKRLSPNVLQKLSAINSQSNKSSPQVPRNTISVKNLNSLTAGSSKAATNNSPMRAVDKTLPKQSFIPQNKSREKAVAKDPKSQVIQNQAIIDSIVAREKLKKAPGNGKAENSSAARSPQKQPSQSQQTIQRVANQYKLPNQTNTISITKVNSTKQPVQVSKVPHVVTSPSPQRMVPSVSQRPPSASQPLSLASHKFVSPISQRTPQSFQQSPSPLSQKNFSSSPRATSQASPTVASPARSFQSQTLSSPARNVSLPVNQKINSAQLPTPQKIVFATQKRTNNAMSQSQPSPAKRSRLDLDQSIKIVSRDEREKLLARNSSVIEDIVEIE